MKSIKKLCLALLACLCTSATVFGLASCEGLGNFGNANNSSNDDSESSVSSTLLDDSDEENKDDSSQSEEESSQEESVSNENSSEIEESSSDEKEEEEDTPPVGTGDMANLDYVSTQIINNWVVHSDLSLQSDSVSENSTSAIRGSFNNVGADCYTGEGGNWVWTAVCFDLKSYYGSSQNLQGKCVPLI